MVLVPQVVDAVKIPVVAAGGIGDGRGLVAAMALGAEGIQMGTRFLATKECPIEETYKQAILEAKDNGTIIAARKGYPLRVFKSNAAMTIRKMDESGVSLEEINAYVDKISRGSQDDRENRLMSAGQVSGMIKGIISVDELIRNMVAEAQTIAQSLGKTF
jgi:enoyl-[acyl-carrier protein] reductase II